MTYEFIERKNYTYCDPFGFAKQNKPFIYKIVDPRDNQIRYIGQTINGLKRITNHFVPSVGKRSNNKKTCWIKSIQKSGNKPVVLITHTAETREELDQLEIDLIKKFEACVHLTNHAVGGASKKSLIPTPKKKYYYCKRKPPNEFKKQMVCLVDQFGKYYPSITDAAKSIGSYAVNIRKQLSGKISHNKGFVFTKVFVGNRYQIEGYIADCLAVKAKYPKPENQ